MPPRTSRHKRAPLLVPVELVIEGERAIEAVARDISIGGTRLLVQPSDAALLKVGAKVVARLNLPLDGGRVEAPGTLSWQNPDAADVQGRPRVAVGCTFDALDPYLRQLVGGFV